MNSCLLLLYEAYGVLHLADQKHLTALHSKPLACRPQSWWPHPIIKAKYILTVKVFAKNSDATCGN